MYDYEGDNGLNINQEDNPQNNRKKKNNNRSVWVIVAVVLAVFVLASVVFVAVYAVKDSGNSQLQNILKNQENSTQKYDDIASTNTGKSSTTEGVIVTDVSSVINNTMPSVVSITSKTTIESNGYSSFYDYYFGGGDSRQYEQEGAGSGIIMDQTDTELLVVTNNHVVEGADSLKIQFYEQDAESAVDGYIKGTDANADVAVVAVKLKDISNDILKKIKKATLGDSDTLNVGEGVIAIGNALGYGQSVTTGIISAKDREVTVENKKMKLLQTDAAINGGNSGGALLNSKGEVIGINVAKYSSNGSTSASIEGMGFAIPITSVKNIISNLETRETRTKVEESQRGYLGIRGYDVTDDVAQQYAMPKGVYIYETTKNGPADKAGIESSDVIVEFDGQSVTSMDTLKQVMEYYKAGENVKVKISYRDGKEYKEKEVTVTLGKESVLDDMEDTPQLPY